MESVEYLRFWVQQNGSVWGRRMWEWRGQEGGRPQRKDDRDRREGSDGMADMLERRQSFLGTLPQTRETKKKLGSSGEMKKPCLQRRDLAGLPLLCLSGSGLQRQRKSRTVQTWCWCGGWRQTLPQLGKDERQKVFSVSSMGIPTQTRRFLFLH